MIQSRKDETLEKFPLKSETKMCALSTLFVRFWKKT